MFLSFSGTGIILWQQTKKAPVTTKLQGPLFFPLSRNQTTTNKKMPLESQEAF